MVTFTEPSSAGQVPEIQRKLFSRSPVRPRVRVVLPALTARHRVQVGADHDAIPPSIACCAMVAPIEGGADARLTRYEMGRVAGFQRDSEG
jgi:hypothetical protein